MQTAQRVSEPLVKLWYRTTNHAIINASFGESIFFQLEWARSCAPKPWNKKEISVALVDSWTFRSGELGDA